MVWCSISFWGLWAAEAAPYFWRGIYYSYSISELAQQYSLSEREVKYLLGKTRNLLRKFFEQEGVAV